MTSVLLTRPRAASERWARLLAQRGLQCHIDPLLIIEPTHTPRPAGGFDAILLTSAHAAENGAEAAAWHHLPCYCVGEATGEVARAAGFSHIINGSGDGLAIAQLLAESKVTSVLHICGAIADAKARFFLNENNIAITHWPVYNARAADDFRPETKNLFANRDISIIPVFSPRSARILVERIEKNDLAQACAHVSVVALSQAVADMVQTLPWRKMRIAASPAQSDILNAFGDMP